MMKNIKNEQPPICSFCGKFVKRKYGMDLSGNIYCRRVTCKCTHWFKVNIVQRYRRIKSVW